MGRFYTNLQFEYKDWRPHVRPRLVVQTTYAELMERCAATAFNRWTRSAEIVERIAGHKQTRDDEREPFARQAVTNLALAANYRHVPSARHPKPVHAWIAFASLCSGAAADPRCLGMDPRGQLRVLQ